VTTAVHARRRESIEDDLIIDDEAKTEKKSEGGDESKRMSQLTEKAEFNRIPALFARIDDSPLGAKSMNESQVSDIEEEVSAI